MAHCLTARHSYIIIIIITIALNLNPCFSGIIDTSISNHYKSQTIYCTEGEDCTVICDQNEACYNSNIQCPINHSCNIQCLADYSIGIQRVCENASINCTYSNQCDVSCLNENNHPLYPAYACKDATFNWPNNKQYTIRCGGGGNCYGVTIDAPFNDEPFTLDCGTAECQNTVINCPNNSICNVNCGANYACQESIINCGNDVNSDCYVDCASHSACEAAIVNGKGIITKCSGLSACRRAMFPEPPPEKDYTLVCDGSSYVCQEANIKCPSNAGCYITCGGSQACTDVNITWPSDDIYDSTLICIGGNSCLNVDIPPTKKPSVVPTDYPSQLTPMITTEKAMDTVTMFVLENVVKEEHSLMDAFHDILRFKSVVFLGICVFIVILCIVIIILCIKSRKLKRKKEVVNIVLDKQEIVKMEMSNLGENSDDIPGVLPVILGEASNIEDVDDFESEGRRYTKSFVGVPNTHQSYSSLLYRQKTQSKTTDGYMIKTSIGSNTKHH